MAYQNTTAVGAFANWNASAALLDTTELGYEAGYNNTGWNSTFLGELSGQNVTSANNDILVGYNALAPSATLSNQLNIGNLIFGTLPATTSATTFSLLTGGNIGIGTSTPWKTLSVGNANVGSFAISTSTSGCATFSPFGEVYSTGTACGSGGGGTFSTTTSQVSGELINHPNNNTDVVVVGASATTSAPFYIDPNSTKGPFFSVGSSSPFASFSIHGNPTDGSIQTTLFAIGSSTATATTTLFSINNTGNITTSMTGTQCVHEINGLLSGTGSDCGSGGSGRTTTASWPIAFSDCSPETTSTRFAIGGSFFAPMAVVNTTSFTPMVMTFGYATSSAMDCIVHLPTDYSANLTFNAIFTSTTTAAGIVPLDLEATSTANGSQYGNPNAFSQIWPASTTAADRIKLPTVAGVGTSTAISLTGVANLSAGQDILIRLTRWGANAADTMGGDLYLPKMWLTYTSQ